MVLQVPSAINCLAPDMSGSRYVWLQVHYTAPLFLRLCPHSYHNRSGGRRTRVERLSCGTSG